MSTHSDPQPVLRIHKPCPKRWDELAGSGARRFCGQCSLHVHDAAQLTRAEAAALVADGSERVCMRLTYAPDGRALFRDEPSAKTRRAPCARGRAAGWIAAAMAGALAACTRNANQPVAPPPTAPAPPPVETQVLGEIAVEELGDVGVVVEKLGEVLAVEEDADQSTGCPQPPASTPLER